MVQDLSVRKDVDHEFIQKQVVKTLGYAYFDKLQYHLDTIIFANIARWMILSFYLTSDYVENEQRKISKQLKQHVIRSNFKINGLHTIYYVPWSELIPVVTKFNTDVNIKDIQFGTHSANENKQTDYYRAYVFVFQAFSEFVPKRVAHWYFELFHDHIIIQRNLASWKSALSKKTYTQADIIDL